MESSEQREESEPAKKQQQKQQMQKEEEEEEEEVNLVQNFECFPRGCQNSIKPTGPARRQLPESLLSHRNPNAMIF
ncbi:small membrane A-kinase anchor protein isoform X3 [Balaenoptera ricei]|uniref:small membrane A-kinase anchor protein isoform X3 n=1 Tax=Balaenoptera ricei TaxID=2746895 RepID=UPI0028BD98CD|nr:small membrane A-kinase anchor protein isoform X3 [Balaenoptera ricei]XP_059784344.1 small membrane A-kinase anchor protein isoform X3 [Balaenoptera ricei]XP_059784345.1 small membrane A-kinase anchor protein isoform X3 [Balaenoptera ricei]XP_059784346.1 small membrane A-kinase anchor protein isoform X3 [Balaenoptera ricei]XP_059784347.1 small membrane A-kinase anchor protein isoform X3 [Balaenoptera ricei]XP_059784348.1 small membrane A-kinase anchor protein isoform X3 [Balaenoptera ricei]